MADAPKFCPDCGEALEPGAVFCGNCGCKINQEAAAPPPAPTPKPAPAEPKPRPTPKTPQEPPKRARPAPRRVPAADETWEDEPAPADVPAAHPSLGRILGATIGNTILMALFWAIAWGGGALLVFHELTNPGQTFGEIAQYGFSPDDIDFASNTVVAGALGGIIAGFLMVFPYAGVFATGFSQIFVVLAGWGAVMALSRYAAIMFNIYLPEHIVLYFSVCGFAIGFVIAVSLAGQKNGGHFVRILLTSLIWAASGGLARYAVISAIGY